MKKKYQFVPEIFIVLAIKVQRFNAHECPLLRTFVKDDTGYPTRNSTSYDC